MDRQQLELPPAPERLLLPPAERVARIHPLRIALVAAAILTAAFLVGYLPRHRRNQTVDQAALKEAQSIPAVNVVKVRRSPAISNLLLPPTLHRSPRPT